MEAYTYETQVLDAADFDTTPGIIGWLSDDHVFLPIVRTLTIALLHVLFARARRLGFGSALVAALVLTLAAGRAAR